METPIVRVIAVAESKVTSYLMLEIGMDLTDV
jgi:hypothetical protein